MIQGRRVLAVVPARGGSKGIPFKNLRPVLGRSLVERAGDIASQVTEIDRRIVSTDHPDIAAAAQRAGLDAPFLRPDSISGDRISDWDVLNHALLATEALDGQRYDIIVMMQPTSPLRKAEHVSGALRMLITESYDAVWTVSPSDTKAHPLKQLVVTEGRMDYWDPRGAAIIARQQLTPVYHRNGVAYAITRECLVAQKSIKGESCGALIIEGPQVSIDTEEDLLLAEMALAKQSA